MLPKYHFIASAVVAALIYPYLGIISLFAIAGGWLIDVDHYIAFIFRKKSLNFFKAYKYHLELDRRRDFRPVIGILTVFHTLEFLLLMIALSFFYGWAAAFTAGMLVHCLMDLIYEIRGTKRIIRNVSVLYFFYLYFVKRPGRR